MDNARFDEYIQFIRENPLVDAERIASAISEKTAERKKLLDLVDQIMSLVDTLYTEAGDNYGAPIGELEARLKERRQQFKGKSTYTELSWFWYRYCNLEFKMLIDAGYSAKDAKLEIAQDPDFMRNWTRLTGRKKPPSQRVINERLQIKKIDREFESPQS